MPNLETTLDRGRRSMGVGVRRVAPNGDRVSPSEAERDARAARSDVWAVVLAGGKGTRLRAFVRQVLGSERPKQFCRIIGTRSMLRHTWDRAARVAGPDRIVTVITAGHERFLEEEARSGVPGTVLTQPANKGTAPGLLLPLLWIARRAPTAAVAVFPADQFVWEETLFGFYVRAALAVTDRMPHRLALLGLEPDAPDVNYGWIAPGESLGREAATDLYTVRQFWEKPDRQTASSLFARGCLWNTLVLAGRLEAYLALADACMPQMVQAMRTAVECLDTGKEVAALAQAYGRIPPICLSRALLAQRSDGLMVLAARGVCWSDWGEPDRILRTLRRFGWRVGGLPGDAGARMPAAAGA